MKAQLTLKVIAPYAAMLILLYLPSVLLTPAGEAVPVLLSSAQSESRDGPWRPVDLNRLAFSDDHGWLRLVYNVGPEARLIGAEPLGLFLSGSYSAAAWLNNHKVMSNQSDSTLKGIPGARREGETPGPIDAVAFLPRENTLPGNNSLLLEISSHYKPRIVDSIIHGTGPIFGLRIGPYSAELRRPISYYAVPFLMTMIYVACGIFLFRRIRLRVERAWSPNHVTLFLIVSLGATALFEISRAFLAYNYAYHGVRLNLIQIGIACFSAFLLIYVVTQSPTVRSRAMLFRVGFGTRLVSSLAPTLLGVVTVVGFILLSFVLSADRGLVITASLLAMVVLVSESLLQKSLADTPLLVALICLLVFAGLDRDLFLDRYLYAVSVPLLACLLWRESEVLTTGPQSQEMAEIIERPNNQSEILDNQFVLKQGPNQRMIDHSGISCIKAAGNYAEVILNEGESLLDDRSLKTLESNLPPQFIRIHRSFMVNLHQAADLQSLGAGKYRLIMNDGSEYPVSRNRIKALREIIVS